MKTAVSVLGLSFLAGAVVACGGTLSEAPKASSGGTSEQQESRPEESRAASPEAPPASEPLAAPVDVAGLFEAADEAVEAHPAPPPLAVEAASGAGSAERDDGDGASPVPKGEGRGAVSAARRSRASKPAGAVTPAPLAGGVRAGEWDDNANFREFSRYVAGKRGVLDLAPLPIDARRFVVVRDRSGRPVPNCRVDVAGRQGGQAQLTTQSSGRALLFPRAEGLKGSRATLTATCLGQSATATTDLVEPDDVVVLTLPGERALPRQRTVDIVFVLDTTGSMSEEIDALKGTIAEVADTLRRQNARPRLGLVEYKDLTDTYVTRLHQMTTDVTGFSERVGSLTAEGGGDMPEHVNAGLAVAVDKIRWNPDSVARLAFLIGDAPPQLGYEQDVSYAETVKKAGQRGIQFFTIAASGMDDLGQVVWRQIAQYTGGTNMFVLRGGAGPSSTGAGDAQRSCGGTHQNYSSGNLATLITEKVSGSLSALDGDPMKIAGLGGDEKAKPCSERVTLAR